MKIASCLHLKPRNTRRQELTGVVNITGLVLTVLSVANNLDGESTSKLNLRN